ncbi:hypothetical protein M426DRAFT_19797 [Hypoxylon sp. CI-4A]|nr:hypothetical protein M426DRAFT_19797 [Hypoxylon sp. CI-4A]
MAAFEFQAPEEWNRPVLVVGIDFGTTSSGVSYAVWEPEKNRQIQPKTIMQWPGYNMFNQEDTKVNSAIAYADNGEFSWGRQAMGKENCIQWFKLLLPGNEELSPDGKNIPHIQQAAAAMQRLGKDVTEVTGDYLRAIFAHSMIIINTKVHSVVVDETPLHVVVTVPAIWKEAELAQMERAIMISGILDTHPHKAAGVTFQFASEPEAATMASIFGYWRGGTVDCNSYSVNDAEPIRIREIVEGEGIFSGGTFLDQEFLSMMERKPAKYGSSWDMIHEVDRRTMLEFWEYSLKRVFDAQTAMYPIDAGVAQGGERETFEVSADELRAVFDSIIPRIEDLIRRQVDAIEQKTLQRPKFIYLVGRISHSPYLVESLKKRFSRPHRIKILQRHDFTGSASVSPARHSFGFVESHVFEDGVHNPRDRFFDSSRGVYMAADQMN